MLNARDARTRSGGGQWSTRLRTAMLACAMLGGCAAIAGCAAQSSPKEQLAGGYQAFDERRYDEAMAAADEILAKNPAGPGSAEASYLRGRVFEQRAQDAGSPDEARRQLQAARNAYSQVLASSPAPVLEAYARAGIANVAYRFEDYATAAREWTAAFPQMDRPEAQAWVLYRAGLCQQRLGQFGEADRLFHQAQQQFPNTDPARRAAAHAGATAFVVQVGIFANAANADAAVATLRSLGLAPLRAPDAAGRQVVSVGPLPTYEQAKAAKARLSGQYPTAVIVP